jgi:hypothetical protein
MKELEMVPMTSEEVTPEEYLKMDQALLQSVRVRPAVLGERGFGRIVVEYKTPIYKYGRRTTRR